MMKLSTLYPSTMTDPFQCRRFQVVGVSALFLLILLLPGHLSAEDRMKGPELQPIRKKVIHDLPVSTLKWVGSGAIHLYSKVISPADGPRSPSYPTSTAYSREAINTHGFLMGILLTADRLLHEADINKGPRMIHHGVSRYYDPVKYNTYWWFSDSSSN